MSKQLIYDINVLHVLLGIRDMCLVGLDPTLTKHAYVSVVHVDDGKMDFSSVSGMPFVKHLALLQDCDNPKTSVEKQMGKALGYIHPHDETLTYPATLTLICVIGNKKIHDDCFVQWVAMSDKRIMNKMEKLTKRFEKGLSRVFPNIKVQAALEFD